MNDQAALQQDYPLETDFGNRRQGKGAFKLQPPVFEIGIYESPTVTIYHSHYDRLTAVLAAARTGNVLLIRLAVEHQDRFGSDGEPSAA